MKKEIFKKLIIIFVTLVMSAAILSTAAFAAGEDGKNDVQTVTVTDTNGHFLINGETIAWCVSGSNHTRPSGTYTMKLLTPTEFGLNHEAFEKMMFVHQNSDYENSSFGSNAMFQQFLFFLLPGADENDAENALNSIAPYTVKNLSIYLGENPASGSIELKEDGSGGFISELFTVKGNARIDITLNVSGGASLYSRNGQLLSDENGVAAVPSGTDFYLFSPADHGTIALHAEYGYKDIAGMTVWVPVDDQGNSLAPLQSLLSCTSAPKTVSLDLDFTVPDDEIIEDEMPPLGPDDIQPTGDNDMILIYIPAILICFAGLAFIGRSRKKCNNN